MKRNIDLIFLLLAISSNVHAKNFGSNSDCATNPPDFSKLSYQEANDAVDLEDALVGRGAKKICPEYITNLVYQLRYEHLTNDNKTLAIYLLGELRPFDTNAIEILMEYIDFRASKIEPNLRPVRWGIYPAEGALMKIGKPVVNPVLEHLPSESNELRRQLMCDVLLRVEGKEAAQNQIKQKLADELDSTKQTNLATALKELEK